jgi:hypothetical protein
MTVVTGNPATVLHFLEVLRLWLRDSSRFCLSRSCFSVTGRVTGVSSVSDEQLGWSHSDQGQRTCATPSSVGGVMAPGLGARGRRSEVMVSVGARASARTSIKVRGHG